jgi:ABC-type transporter Mla maintaining outer membrane lipid asymmetry permease subunit MlaE
LVFVSRRSVFSFLIKAFASSIVITFVIGSESTSNGVTCGSRSAGIGNGVIRGIVCVTCASPGVT